MMSDKGGQRASSRPDSRQDPIRSSETQTATVPTRERAPDGAHNRPARVPGDVDEARDIPVDIVTRRGQEPDASSQSPAAAPSITDEEAGMDDRPEEGGIEPLVRRGS